MLKSAVSLQWGTVTSNGFGFHKRAASSQLTLTAVPAPHPWLGHASGLLCQAKLLEKGDLG